MDFLSTWERWLSYKAFAFQSLGGLAYEDNLLFIVNFSGSFHSLLTRQPFLLGWLLSFLSSGLSLGLVDLNWLCALSFISHMLPWLPLSDGLGGGHSFCSWPSSSVELWCVVWCSYLPVTVPNLFYLLSYPSSQPSLQFNEAFIQWQLGRFIAGTAFKK